MPRFAANLSMLFTEVPFLDRFDRAARAGFEAVEFLFPYDHPAEEVARAIRDAGVRLALHNLPAGNWAAGERGIACHPDRVEEFCEGLVRALDYARVLGTPQINCLAGIRLADVDEATARATLVGNLRQAAATLGRKGVRLLIEPINTFDIPGFFVSRTAQALTEDVAATLPGSPQLIPSPGHTGGHCSYVFGDVLVAGDAVITGHPVITKGGPQLLPQMFNHDQEACERSLSALGLLDTQVLLPGHGPAWRGPVREAAELALQRS